MIEYKNRFYDHLYQIASRKYQKEVNLHLKNKKIRKSRDKNFNIFFFSLKVEDEKEKRKKFVN